MSANDRIIEQPAVTGITEAIGADSIYRGDERVGATVTRADADAQAWVDAHR